MISPRFLFFPSHCTKQMTATNISSHLAMQFATGLVSVLLGYVLFIKLGLGIWILLFPFAAFLSLEISAWRNPSKMNALNGYILFTSDEKVKLRAAAPLMPQLRYLGIQINSIAEVNGTKVVNLIDGSQIGLDKLSTHAQNLLEDVYRSLKDFLETGKLPSPSKQFQRDETDSFKYYEGYQKPPWFFWLDLSVFSVSWVLCSYLLFPFFRPFI